MNTYKILRNARIKQSLHKKNLYPFIKWSKFQKNSFPTRSACAEREKLPRSAASAPAWRFFLYLAMEGGQKR